MSAAASTSKLIDDIAFHPLSVADPGGRVFWWKGQLYRGIAADRAAHFQSLFDRGIIARLVEQKLLVESTVVDLQLPPFAMVVQHRAVRYVTYAPEWPGGMLRRAADLVLTIQELLSHEGLMLQDGHPWNVLFDGVQPRFVDLTSIVPPRVADIGRRTTSSAGSSSIR